MSDSTQRIRVLLLHNFMTPYRVPLFAELAKRFDLDVWIMGDVRKIREWPGAVPDDAFRYQILPNLSLYAGSRDYRVLLNPGIMRALKRHQHDVLIICGWDTPAALLAGRYARRTGTPLVVWSGSTAGEPNWRRRLAAKLVRRHVGQADAWIAYGTRAQAYLESLGADTSHIFKAYNTVETERFQAEGRLSMAEREKIRTELGVDTRFMVLYGGQLIPRKGLDDFLPAFGEVVKNRGDITLVVAGSGPHEARYRTLAKTSGADKHTRFIGFAQRETLPRLYGAADLFTLPSREEVWGLVLNEALACGTPVLTTTNTGASEDLVDQGRNGYTVPAGDCTEMTRVMLEYFSDDTDRDAMRQAAALSIAPYTISAMADAFEAAVKMAMAYSA